MRVGEVDGVPVLLQREYVEADVRIITGFVEPHFFAGFSGGPKAVCPGLAATETILEAHHPRRIADARATFLTRQGNPVHDFVRAAVALAPPQLSLDVAINRARRVTAVFAGPLAATHDAACAHVGAAARREVPEPSTSWSRRTGATRSTATCTRRSRAWRRPSGSCATSGDQCHGRRVRGRRARRRGLRPPAGRRRARRPTSSPPRPGPSSTAGRPRCWAACWRAAEVAASTATASTTPPSADALLIPVADLDGAVAAALGRSGDGARVAVIPEGPLTVATVAAARVQARPAPPDAVSGIESPQWPSDPLFEFAVPDDLLREAVSQVKDPDVVADLDGHAGHRGGQAAAADRHPAGARATPPSSS